MADAQLACLSVLQPWAWLIVHGHKPVENRTWPTRFRGRLLIQAGKAYDGSEHEDHAVRLLEEFGIELPRFSEMPRGAIVGEATVTDCVTQHSSRFFTGPYGFVLAAPRAYPAPVPLRGQLGIFRVPASALDNIGAKAAYVRSQGQTRDHLCHWPSCTRQVPPAAWGCRSHWNTLPAELRDRIWRAYRPGQELDGTPSREYLEVAREAHRWATEHDAAAAAANPQRSLL